MNKFLSVALLFLATITTVNAQEWQTDFARAKEIASKENRPIILVFQGSDWCAPCIKLDREVWGTEAFKTYAKKHYVMLQADFPRKSKNALSEEQTKANAKLAEKYNKNGIFPFVIVLNNKGEVLGETSYKKTTPENYIKELNTFVK
ncbi:MULTISPECIES: thioredoxin family protein [Flavobacteriaceae]|uniref:Thioredoxin-related protein n=1 Tax=Maribacter ulvicola TaxID=228959 RepID=A0A1N6QCM0_9FLAO|nr:thioredoxin family protein [Maribacter ulvicola]SIQ14351.1 Thioredoxin-related protein [Maribacter ulvicola]